ncbi:MAG: hypothetical protein C4547_10480 [Phycisphaerales bacterium]|nr:MAG: hypothetical protein C4547_10480 [Phycisphaerales bacterium]
MSAKDGVELDRTIRERVREYARAHGLKESVVFKEAVEEYLRLHGGETLYERARRAGLIGSLPDLPSDLSSNRAHMEGFGRE